MSAAAARAWDVLAGVMDPEIPVLGIVDLGIVRHVRQTPDGTLEVGLAPTYSGCPATAVIQGSVRAALAADGFARVTVVDVLSPPWSSDWLSAAGRHALARYGIAPPVAAVTSPRRLWGPDPAVTCPRCASRDTAQTSAHGSTPCKALYRCNACREPFEYFKCL